MADVADAVGNVMVNPVTGFGTLSEPKSNTATAAPVVLL
jgi:hypothetical protein